MEKAVLRTIAYADIFDYPLTAKEIWQWLIENLKFKVQSEKLQFKIQELISGGELQERYGFYFLKGRQKIVEIRKKREKWSQKKLKITKKVAKWLKIIPTIKMVGVTGALAMNNADKNEDIDFLIVTQKNRLWLTRFLTVLLVELVAKRRHPADKEVKDKICLNMFLDEKHLGIPEEERNLFTAHEICQMRSLWNRDGIYRRFLADNQWVKKYLPNAVKYDF